MSPSESTPTPKPQFAETHWSLVLAAGHSHSPRADEALARLCQNYWYPLYAFVRRQGHNPHDAEDLTQEFFSRLLAKKYLADVDRAKGKFRSFLLAAMKHFLANEWDRARAQKRGGGQQIISIDHDSAESRLRLDPAHAESADKIYDRQWALTLLDQVLASLRAEHTAAGKTEMFEQLKGTITGGGDSAGYAELATRFQTTEGAVKVVVHRLRQRYRELLRAHIAETLNDPADADDELRQLFRSLS